MRDEELQEEMAHRANDRNGNPPLRRSSDPDRVAHHLAVADDNRLISAKATDGFTSESPIRAFTEFRVSGVIAIGKGFRPSLAHLHTYLDAMEQKEGWRFVQIILPDTDAGDPTILFHKPMMPLTVPNDSDAAGLSAIHRAMPGLTALVGDDPVNPRHYAGTRCAEIGELLTANSYQVLKYNWRLGEKDDPIVELGKSLWYLDREIALLDGYDVGDPSPFPAIPNKHLPVQSWFDERLEDANEYLRGVAHFLIDWNRFGDGITLRKLRLRIAGHKATIECGSGAAV